MFPRRKSSPGRNSPGGDSSEPERSTLVGLVGDGRWLLTGSPSWERRGTCESRRPRNDRVGGVTPPGRTRRGPERPGGEDRGRDRPGGEDCGRDRPGRTERPGGTDGLGVKVEKYWCGVNRRYYSRRPFPSSFRPPTLIGGLKGSPGGMGNRPRASGSVTEGNGVVDPSHMDRPEWTVTSDPQSKPGKPRPPLRPLRLLSRVLPPVPSVLPARDLGRPLSEPTCPTPRVPGPRGRCRGLDVETNVILSNLDWRV